MQRYFINEEDFFETHAYIKGQDVHHIRNVMRMKENDYINIVLNSKEYNSKIERIEKDLVEVIIIKEIENDSELKTKITIAHGLVRKEKMDLVVKIISEIGVYAYYPVLMQRINVKFDRNKEFKMDRYKTIAKEASELSNRTEITKIFQPISFDQLIGKSVFFDLCLVAYENETNYDAFKNILDEFKGKNILIVIGPEGGFDEKEVTVLKNNNFKFVSLGKRILSTVSAPIVAASILSFYLENGKKNED
ncbi:MAG: RsmE family RNA methyltransferase [Bacilli bacterium]